MDDEDSEFFVKRLPDNEPSTMSISVKRFDGVDSEFDEFIRGYAKIYTDRLAERFSDSGLVEEGDTSLGSHPAYFVAGAYTLENSGVEIEIFNMQVLSVRNDLLYLVNFETPNILFDETYDEAMAMLATFNFE